MTSGFSVGARFHYRGFSLTMHVWGVSFLARKRRNAENLQRVGTAGTRISPDQCRTSVGVSHPGGRGLVKASLKVDNSRFSKMSLFVQVGCASSIYVWSGGCNRVGTTLVHCHPFAGHQLSEHRRRRYSVGLSSCAGRGNSCLGSIPRLSASLKALLTFLKPNDICRTSSSALA